jgi:hypothetical protein
MIDTKTTQKTKKNWQSLNQQISKQKHTTLMAQTNDNKRIKNKNKLVWNLGRIAYNWP